MKGKDRAFARQTSETFLANRRSGGDNHSLTRFFDQASEERAVELGEALGMDANTIVELLEGTSQPKPKRRKRVQEEPKKAGPKRSRRGQDEEDNEDRPRRRRKRAEDDA